MRRGSAKYVTLVTGMRCSSCGTENATDSRFCGGCGARLASSERRVAPTQKISDDASFPQAHPSGPGAVAAPQITPSRALPAPIAPTPPPLAAPIGSHPPSAMPLTPAPRVTPVAGPPGPIPHSGPRPIVEGPFGGPDASAAMPVVARRPWGLIAVVLLFDVGLAVAGAWMLAQGLGARPSATVPAPAAPRGSP
jgi:zinc ribbon protein